MKARRKGEGEGRKGEKVRKELCKMREQKGGRKGE